MAYDTDKIRADNPMSEVVARYTQVTTKRHESLALCPAHNDTTPSLNISNEKGFVKCFACGFGGDQFKYVMKVEGCDFKAACEILGGDKTSAYTPPAPWRRPASDDTYANVTTVFPVPPLPPIGEPLVLWNNKKRKNSTLYTTLQHPYHTSTGEVIGYVVRYMAGNKKCYSNVRWGYTECDATPRWVNKPFDKPTPLYNLHHIAQTTGQVLVVEGEKSADAATSFLGMTATAWIGGANNINSADWHPLAGRSVLLWPDADEPGFACMRKVTEILHNLGCKVKVIAWDQSLPEKFDVADAAQQWTVEQTIEWMRANASEYAPPAPEPTPEHQAQILEFAPLESSPLYEPPPFDDIPIEYYDSALIPDYLPQPDEAPPPAPAEPPAPEPVTTITRRKRNEVPTAFEASQPFRALGYSGNYYYFIATTTQSVIELTSAQFAKNTFYRLSDNEEYWMASYPHTKSGFDVNAATRTLMKACHDAGHFDSNRIRGRGAWWDGNKIAIHLGDTVIINEKVYKPAQAPSRFIYEERPMLDVVYDAPINVQQAQKFLNLMRMMPFKDPLSAIYTAGWCVLAHIAGALQWRPHLWATGAAGSGKTTLVSEVVKPILGQNLIFVEGSSSEAGVRQYLGSDSLPVLFDEAEGDTKKSQMRIQSVLELIRSSSSSNGSVIARGTTQGEAMLFDIRSCFCLSSINATLVQASDKSRMTIVEVAKECQVHPIEEIRRIIAELFTPEFVSGFHARALHQAYIIRKNCFVFSQAAASIFKSQRAGDQYGSLLSGAYSLFSDDEISYEDAVAWVSKQDWTEQVASVAVESDEYALVSFILSKKISVNLMNSREDVALGELIRIAAGEGKFGLVPQDAFDILLRVGIRVQSGFMYISTNYAELRLLLRDTPWYTSWGAVLARRPGAVHVQNVQFAGTATPAIKIPLPGQQELFDEAS